MWVNYHVALIKQLCGSAVEPLLLSLAKVLAKIGKTSLGEVCRKSVSMHTTGFQNM